MSSVIQVNNPCGARTGEGGLREQYATWSPSERQEFVQGLAGLGWVPIDNPDPESPRYPGFIALPGNPCYQGINAGPTPGGGTPGDPFGVTWQNARNPSGILAWLADLWARLSAAVRDALARLMAGLGGAWLAILAALLVGGGILLAGRDRQARA